MGLTRQQQDAVDNIRDWYKETSTRACPSYTLEGAAGCGKSYTISYLLNILPGNKVALSPTNKAKKVLEDFLINNGASHVDVLTIHSALGYRVNDSTQGYKIKGRRVVAQGSTSTEATGMYKVDDKTDLIIVDEASMVDVLMERELLDLASSIEAKILWVGDGYQLRPVNGVRCSAFKSNNRSSLKEVVRYDGGSLKIATGIRDMIDKGADKKPLNELVALQNDLEPELHNVHLIGQKEWERRIKNAVDKEDDFKIIAYKNNSVIAHNALVRHFRGRTSELMRDDTLISLKPVPIDNFRMNKHISGTGLRFFNGETAVINRNTPYSISLSDHFFGKSFDEIEMYTIEPEAFLKDLVLGAKETKVVKPGRLVNVSSKDRSRYSNIDLIFIDPTDFEVMAELINEINEIVQKYKLFTEILYGLPKYHAATKFERVEDLAAGLADFHSGWRKDQVVSKEGTIEIHEYLVKNYGRQLTAQKIVDMTKLRKRCYSLLKAWEGICHLTCHWGYSDALTVHKVQGSTFTDVYLDGGDIIKGSPWKNLLYVSLTRASRNVYIKE